MKAKYYAPQAKAVAIFIILVSLVAAGISGFGVLMTAYVGGYGGEAGYYTSSAYHHAIEKHIADADLWYALTLEKTQQTSQTYASERRYEQLTEMLQKASLHTVRVEGGSEENGGDIALQTPIAGVQIDPLWELLDYRESYAADGTAYGYQIYFDPHAAAEDDFMQGLTLYEKRHADILTYPVVMGSALFIALVFWIYLLAVSGRNASGELVLRSIHRVPLDFLTVLFLIPFMLCVILASEISPYQVDFGLVCMLMALLAACVAAGIAAAMVWVHTVAARLKGRMLLRSTLVGMVCVRIWRSFYGGAQQLMAAGQQAARRNQEQAVAQTGAGHKRFMGAAHKLRQLFLQGIAQMAALFRSLHVIWKLCGIVALILAAVELLAIESGYDSGGFVVLLALNIAILLAVGFFAMQLDRLKKGAQHLASGDLGYKIDTEHMYWDLQQHAKNLNAIAGGMSAAVEEQLKSERMKYELLTNVSHDIKTPLTSIINYVDLLKNEENTAEQMQTYLAVLDRQSAKLKKLITDLIEVSKATTGNVSVEAARMQAGELLRQCVGEYSERFAENSLEAVLHVPADEPAIYADGRLLWQVLDNLLGNIVKYAMPGTRVYLDAEAKDGQMVVSLKNISRERLHTAGDELMERFVRGDASRATEGSGLGLSIARSLVELMGGEFTLIVDGDLFKVAISFDQMNKE